MATLYSYGSNSKGSLYLLEFLNFNIVLDCGLNDFYKTKDFNFLKWNKVKYVLITHEHYDHILFLKKFMKTFNQPKIIINKLCYDFLVNKDSFYSKYFNRFIFLDYQQNFSEDNFKVLALKVNHNSVANNGYLIWTHNKKILYLTDCGSFEIDQVNSKVFKNIDLFMVESNYLETKQPVDLKEIKQMSDNGHFSRLQAFNLMEHFLKLEQTTNPVLVLIHTSLNAYDYPAINDKFYQLLNIKYHRLKPIEFDKVDF